MNVTINAIVSFRFVIELPAPTEGHANNRHHLLHEPNWMLLSKRDCRTVLRSLKHEWTKFEEFENLDEARVSVFKYIETFYNSMRIHSTLEYQTPDEVERKYRAALAA